MTTNQLAKARQSCPNCQESDVIKFGKSRNGQQVFMCKPCNKTFTEPREGINEGRRIPASQVGAAIQMFYSGLSISEIARNMADIFEIPELSKATIHEWITDYTRLATDFMKQHKAETGDLWVADEMVVKVGGKNYWNWNVMDADTRYILASHLSLTRTKADAIKVFEKAKANATNLPKEIKTDRLRSYIDGIEQVFGADVKHIQSDGIHAEVNNNLSERLQGTFRQRVKVLRGLQSRESAQLFLDGWTINYNLFRPHEGLKGKTPSQAAKLGVGFDEWEEFAKMDVRPFSEIRRRREVRRQRTVKAKNPFRGGRL